MTAFTLFLLLSLLLRTSHSCDCIPQPFVSNFHTADSVVRALVVRSFTVARTPRRPCISKPCPAKSEYQTAVFKLKIIVVYKGCGPSTGTFRAISRTGPGYCGTFLKPGERYVLNLGKEVALGKKGKTGFEIGSCEGHTRFDMLTVEQLVFLGEEAGKPENHCVV